MTLNFFGKAKRFLRKAALRKQFKSFGQSVTLMEPCMITNPQYIEIGDNVRIREYSRIEAVDFDGATRFHPVLKIKSGTKIEQFFHIGACEYVEICENVLIAGRVYISDHNHCFSDVNKPIMSQGIKSGGRVIIQQNAWLGEGCVILPGVTVGRNSIVGANAVVTKDVPPYSIVVGSPAKIIKQYDASQQAWMPLAR
jgi:acetyltransferase-like isoleucine patch superfamily enzyme